MTRLDVAPPEAEGPVDCDGPRALVVAAREVPLGGVRGMEVHRTLPHRALPMVGAWCFLDRFGPQDTLMRVEPHPHIGLQTVTWPIVGEVRHRDAVGSDVVVRPGALNLMTSGAGIAHSEYSVGKGPIPLDALQLWVALPESRRHSEPAFERHEDLPVLDLGEGADAVVVMGELGGTTSPATVHTPLVGAEIRLPAGVAVRIPLRLDWEYAVYGMTGTVEAVTGMDAVDADAARRPGSAPEAGPTASIDHTRLVYLGKGRDHLELRSEDDARVFLLGGEPFEADIVMWWNFVGRSHDEIVAAREAWEAGTARFGPVIDHGPERIPAPPLPAVKLTPRRRRS
ncbi:redox-sensitive bicupin YhaK (pirin superfamily) [Microbacterium testaceum]|uniref:pirin family protein n=1 Tax=Microbacterium TaxID=33882 RepID=UPI0027866321|nr:MULTISPECIES: pirin family protein [Microbacterium]MDQ1112539.1 redox-sensitive bicupin YhaK (pirin superfamily) [Microbacterium testaceum]MDR6096924.1 redox-sensitive bicupin YhaK (pirin superfamily) [Microbacterium sp. SORGH_AS_0454]